MNRLLVLIIVAVAACLCGVQVTAATTPNFMNYQGRLTNSLGSPVDLTTPMTFTIYADSLGGAPIWTETQDTVIVRNGIFTVRLGSVVPVSDTVFKSDRRWLEIRVGTDAPMSPRTPFVSVAYAFRSTYADSCTFVPTTDTLWQRSGSDIYRNSGKVGLGTSTPSARLDIVETNPVNAVARFKAAAAQELRVHFEDPMGGYGYIGKAEYDMAGLQLQNKDQGNAVSIVSDEGDINLRVHPHSGGAWEDESQTKLHVDGSTGNVGIGTSEPANKLDVNGRARAVSFGIGPGSPWADNRICLDAGFQESYISWDNRLNCGFLMYQGQGTNTMYNRSSGGGSTEEWKWVSAGLGDIFTIGPSIIANRNVGIGTASPNQRLSVTGMIGVHPEAWVQPTTRGLFLYHNGIDANIYAFDYVAGNPDPLGFAGRDISLTTYDAVGSAHRRLYVHNSGDVGIGTTSPTCRLDVIGQVKGQTSSDGVNTIQGTSAGNFSGVAGINTGSGPGVYGYTVSSDHDDAGVVGHNVATSGSTVGVYGLSDSPAGTGVLGSVASGGFGVYGWEPAGGSGWAIYADGDCKVNAKMSIGAASATNILTVVQSSITDPVADAWTTYSSRRWKENITPIPNALDKVSRLRGVYYDWKENHKHDLGMIAEEVGEVLPEIVQFEENGVDAQSLDYARLSAVLVEAVKELKSENDDLRKRLELLEQRLNQYGVTTGTTK